MTKLNNNLTVLNKEDTRELNAGATTYRCPFGCKTTGGYWSVYAHCLTKGCFKNNKVLNGIWSASKFCFSTAFSNELCRQLNVLGRVGKHAMR